MRLKLLFFPLSIVLGLIILIWMAKPEWDVMKTKKAEKKDVERQLEELTIKVQSIEKAYSDYSSLSVDRELVMNAVPYDFNDEEFVSEMYQKVKEEKLLVTHLNVEKKKPAAVCTKEAAGAAASEDVESGSATTSVPAQKCTMPLLERGVTVEVEGDYVSVKRFITSIEKMNRLFSYSKYSISKLNTNSSNSTDPAQQTQTAAAPVVASLTFYIFSKPFDEKLDLVADLDPPSSTMSKLLAGKLDMAQIETFKENVISAPYPAVTIKDPIGKENIFAPAQ